MPQIFDNIELKLFDGLCKVLPGAEAGAFCVGYLNLRGWGQVADLVESLPGGEPFEEKMGRLVAKLREQQAEAAKLDAAIAVNLKELGYGG